MTNEDFLNVKGSLYLLQKAEIEVEFRTTVVPPLHKQEDILAIARHIQGASRYSLQQFNPGHTLNPDYSYITPYTREELQYMAQECRPYVKEVKVLNT